MKDNFLGKKMSLWTPLIGFDVEQSDLGVEEYLNTVGFVPDSISLFVFNPDIINMHKKGMETEEIFPEDYCNYYGSRQNDIRHIQRWTNFKLKQLCFNLKTYGIKVYLGIMGLHTNPEDAKKFGGNFGYIARQEFLIQNQEICQEGTSWTGATCILKRMRTGELFEDFFADKVEETLEDYGADGIHLADGFFPPCMQLDRGDYSFDMIRQFDGKNEGVLPKELVENIDGKYNDINARASFIWNNYRAQWIRFYAIRYKEFFEKLCTKLHRNNKFVMINNVWTCEPFETYYRYGVDYKMIADAGIDEIAIEDQATTAYVVDPDDLRLKNYERYITPMLTRIYAPQMKYYAISFVKDSTEEASMISHMPCACEREIFSLSYYHNIDENGCGKSIDGFFVCLADSLKKQEWDWVNKRYKKALDAEIDGYFGATAIISDNFVDGFLEDYIVSRRWSAHKQIAGLNRYYAGINAVSSVKNIDRVNGNIFVPNADLLNKEELKKILSYKNGVIVLSTIVSKMENFKNTSFDLCLVDKNVKNKKFRSVAYVYNCKTIDISVLEEDENVEKCVDYKENDLSNVKDSWLWSIDMVFRKVSSGFLKTISKILKTDRIFYVEQDREISYVKLRNGTMRVFIPNLISDKYAYVNLFFKKQLVKVENVLEFPVHSPKLIFEGNIIRSQQDLTAREIGQAKGALIKICPFGIAVYDFQFK